MLLTIAAVFLALLAGKQCWDLARRLVRVVKLRRTLTHLVPEAEPGHWFWGHLDLSPTNEHYAEQSLKRSALLPRMYLFRPGIFFTPMVGLSHPDTISKVARAPKYRFVFDLLMETTGDGLLTSSGGKKWMRDKRLLMGAFGTAMREKYMRTYVDCSLVLVDKWRKACDLNKTGCLLDAGTDMRLLACDVILRYAMACESNCQIPEKADQAAVRYTDAISLLADLTMERLTNPLYYYLPLYLLTPAGRRFSQAQNTVRTFCDQLITQRRQFITQHQGETFEHRNIMDTLIMARDADGSGFSGEEIRAHALTFLDAGHVSTKENLQWVLYYLAQNQEIQDKCRDEVLSYLEDVGGLENVSMKLVQCLPYVVQCIEETLRLVNVAPLSLRQLDEDTEVDGCLLPAGTPVSVSILGVHHNEEFWPEPETFNPDRFCRDSAEYQNRPAEAFIPFALGMRKCIGRDLVFEEMSTILVAILANFRLHPKPGGKKPKRVLKVPILTVEPLELLIEAL